MAINIKKIFEIERKPRKGLLAVEWAILAYMVFTLVLMLITYTKLQNPESMLWGRARFLIITFALWGVYRMIPCRFTLFCRIGAQLALLSWWYPDTYEFNRMFRNLDHVFAGYEQQLFHCQPALLFSQKISNPVFSELMHLGYATYYPLIALVSLFYFLYRYQEFQRATFVILTSFFIYYVVFILLPVTGPQYYYLAAGLDNIANGSFPSVGDYFATHDESLPIPGWKDGFFYQCVASAHAAGERPTAAFPSSHVGVTTILLLLAWHARNRKLVYTILPFFVLMCLATVYIQAHYAVDVIGGWISAVVIYAVLLFFSKKFV